MRTSPAVAVAAVLAASIAAEARAGEPECGSSGDCSGWQMPAASPAAESGATGPAATPEAPPPSTDSGAAREPQPPARAHFAAPTTHGHAPSPQTASGYTTTAYASQPHINFGTQPYPYLPSPDDGDDEEDADPPFFDLAAGTQFPLGLGPQLTLEIPLRILFQAELAWMPAAYGSAINSFIEAFGKEGAIIGPVIEEALADSFVFRGSAGWRPFPKYGFEILGGYTLIKVSGEAPGEVVAGLVGGDLADTIEDNVTTPIAFDSTLHNFHVALGWRFLAIDDHLVIRANIGYTQTVGSSTSAQIADFPELEADINPVVDAELDRILTRDIKLPVLGLNAGYRF
jgi:hypothetical protein